MPVLLPPSLKTNAKIPQCCTHIKYKKLDCVRVLLFDSKCSNITCEMLSEKAEKENFPSSSPFTCSARYTSKTSPYVGY